MDRFVVEPRGPFALDEAERVLSLDVDASAFANVAAGSRSWRLAQAVALAYRREAPPWCGGSRRWRPSRS